MSLRLLPQSEVRLCSAVAVLDSNTWPNVESMSPEYGERELRMLCDKFMLPFSEMKIAYRRFQDNGGKSACATIQSD